MLAYSQNPLFFLGGDDGGIFDFHAYIPADFLEPDPDTHELIDYDRLFSLDTFIPTIREAFGRATFRDRLVSKTCFIISISLMIYLPFSSDCGAERFFGITRFDIPDKSLAVVTINHVRIIISNTKVWLKTTGLMFLFRNKFAGDPMQVAVLLLIIVATNSIMLSYYAACAKYLRRPGLVDEAENYGRGWARAHDLE
jgi:hypothetical protein